MTGKQVNRYLDLVKRRLYILTHSGIDWKPEYTEELKQINQELEQPRPIVDRAVDRARKEKQEYDSRKKRSVPSIAGTPPAGV